MAYGESDDCSGWYGSEMVNHLYYYPNEFDHSVTAEEHKEDLCGIFEDKSNLLHKECEHVSFKLVKAELNDVYDN